ncbi:hypothetical protein Pelo_5853 [Pelomyxa schiedti]|nr:hypothetical protein Pelo_5853 [Pelomyxa schiedti]
MAKRFVETRSWNEEGSGGDGCGGVVWPKESAAQQLVSVLIGCQGIRGCQDAIPRETSPLAAEPAMGGAAKLCDEFWSNRGLDNLLWQVCTAGHLHVLQWVLTDWLQLDKKNELVQHCLFVAAENGQLHMFEWLVSTFDLGDTADTVCMASNFHPMKGRVSDVKLLVETFPHWDFSDCIQSLAIWAASCKGCSADEVIEVCQWLKDRFSLYGQDFACPDTSPSLPKSAKVIKWALSDVTSASDEISSLWSFCCSKAGNVELGKWLVEEKGAIVSTDSFFDTCSGIHDKAEFVEWLVKKLGDELSSSDFLKALHTALANPNRLDLICKWLEKQILTTTGTKPKISLSKLFYCHRPGCDGWLDWVFTNHSEACDLEWSQSEVLDFCNGSSFVLKMGTAVSIWKKFSLCPVTNPQILSKLLLHLVKCGTTSQIQQILSKLLLHLVKCGTTSQIQQVLCLGQFSRSVLESALQEYSAFPLGSSKIVKLLISSLFLGGSRATPQNRSASTPQVIHAVLFHMLTNNKRSCVRWLFNRFKFTLPQFLSANERFVNFVQQVDFATWKLMLKLFQDITRDVVIHNFMGFVVASPLHTQFSMDKLGITQDDIEEFSRTRFRWKP